MCPFRAIPCIAPSPGPCMAPGERPGTHCLTMSNISCYFLRKKLRALPCPYGEDYTNREYRAFLKIDSSWDLTCWTTTFQMWQFKRTVKQKGNKSICQKELLVATEILIFLCTWFVALPWTWSTFTAETPHDKGLQAVNCLELQSLSSIWVKWTCTVCICN